MKLSAEQRKKLQDATGLGKELRFKTKGGGDLRTIGRVVDEVWVMIDDYKLGIQRIEYSPQHGWKGSRYGYRTAYYTLDASGSQLRWGQFAQLIPERHMNDLLRAAKKKGWPIGF